MSTSEHAAELFVISAPSGAGKTSLIAELLARDESLQLSVSYTTRQSRPGEHNGVHYHFIDEAAFQHRIDNGDFLEHATVFGNFYGTSYSAVSQQLAAGKDVLLEIDWQGARQVMAATDCIGIFILPPSLLALQQRLDDRQTDSKTVIEARMAKARAEISHWNEYDYLVVNDDFEVAVEQLSSIISASRLRRDRHRITHHQLLSELLGVE